MIKTKPELSLRTIHAGMIYESLAPDQKDLADKALEIITTGRVKKITKRIIK